MYSIDSKFLKFKLESPTLMCVAGFFNFHCFTVFYCKSISQLIYQCAVDGQQGFSVWGYNEQSCMCLLVHM